MCMPAGARPVFEERTEALRGLMPKMEATERLGSTLAKARPTTAASLPSTYAEIDSPSAVEEAAAERSTTRKTATRVFLSPLCRAQEQGGKAKRLPPRARMVGTARMGSMGAMEWAARERTG